jgi:microcystin-dependent protein
MSLNATPLFIQASPLPATFQGTPNDMFTEMIRRMKILSPSGTNFIFIGDTAPTSNVGPWLKNGTQWWTWDPVTKEYAPQDISASFTPAFVMGHATPSSIDPPVWLQTTLDATSANSSAWGEIVRLFYFDGVNWLAPHPVPPNCPEIRMWIGTEQALWAYDGGDGSNPASTAPTASTGAMWQVETLFQFRFPLGVGANTIGFDGNVASAAVVQEQGGDERVTLAPGETPPSSHTHFVAADDTLAITTFPITATTVPAKQGSEGGATVEYRLAGSALPATLGLTSLVGTTLPATSHQNLPPFVGVFFIKRSTRIYYTP